MATSPPPETNDARKVWAFNGDPVGKRRSVFPSAIFSSLEKAAAWVAERKFTGTLTAYILDEPAFERSLRLGTVSQRDQARGAEIAQVWTGGEEHFHVEEGRILR